MLAQYCSITYLQKLKLTTLAKKAGNDCFLALYVTVGPNLGGNYIMLFVTAVQ